MHELSVLSRHDAIAQSPGDLSPQGSSPEGPRRPSTGLIRLQGQEASK